MSRKATSTMSSLHQFIFISSLFPTSLGTNLTPAAFPNPFRKFTSMQTSQPPPNLQQLEMLRLMLGMSQNGNKAFGSPDAQALLKDNIPQLLQILKMTNEIHSNQGSAVVTPQESPVTTGSNDSECYSPQKRLSTVSSQNGDEDEMKSSPGKNHSFVSANFEISNFAQFFN